MKDNIPIPTQLSVHFDWTDWLPYFEAEDLSEAQKRELIETLWALVLGFVDLGFTVGSIPETSGQTRDLKRALEAAVLRSENQEDA